MKKFLKSFSKIKKIVLLVWLGFCVLPNLKAQGPCESSVPAFTVNLSAQPAGVWTSTNVVRSGTCCSYTSPDKCVYFNLTLNPNTAGIQIDMIGADPPGSLLYKVGLVSPGGTVMCNSTAFAGGTLKCISGVGPHEIILCKPGGNANIYKITSVSKPLFPNDDTTRVGCRKKLITNGIVNTSVLWTAISGTSTAQNNFYNTFLDSVNVASPTFSAPASTYSNITAPFYVDYKVCGFPTASACGFTATLCDTVRVWTYPVLSTTVTPTNPTFCGVGSVPLIANPSGGLSPYTYSWTAGTSTTVIGSASSYVASSANTYYVHVFDKLYDAAYCPYSAAQAQVTVGVVPTITITPSKKVCKTSPLATVSGTVFNANSYTWTTSGTGAFSTPNFTQTIYTPSAFDLTTGSVTLTLSVTGGVGCGTVSKITNIYYSSSPTVTIPPVSMSCFNSTTTIVANASGGITSIPYTYLWNNNATTNSINVGQGNYSVIVSDSLGCSGSANINVVAPTALALTFNVTNVTVNGGNNGSATVNINGGTPAYTLTWSPGGANTTAINTLTYGVYTATVTDANGCKVVSSTIINEPRCLAFTSAISATNASCYKAADGVASVTVSGGVPAYTYTWNTIPAQNTAIATGLNAGVYTAYISDSNVPKCFQTANVVITEPTQLTTVMTHTDVSVQFGSDGSAAVNAFGGTSPYTYLWSTSATTSSITNLTAGIYSVSVTDNKGCNNPDVVKITEPPCNNLVLSVVKNDPLCFGGSGSAQAFVSGASTYTITWSNSVIGANSGSLSPGTYTVSVDTKTCVEFQTFSIVQPSQLSIGLLPTNVSCSDKADGTINITIAGGVIPYTYTWSTGSNSEDLIGLAPGQYSVVVKDASGCTIIGSALISQPNPLSISATAVQSVSCVNGNNGSIALSVIGGVAPYTYSWSTGATTSSINTLSAGGYTVVVKDANNCNAFASPLVIGVLTPDSVKVGSFNVACSIPNSSLTQVSVNPVGGNSSSYMVSYNNGLSYQSITTPTMLTNGSTYTVLVKDANNCVSLLSKTLTILPEVKIDSVSFSKCYTVGATTTQVIVYPSGGDGGLYQVSFNNGVSYQPAGNYTLNANVASSYSIIAIDTRSCVSSTTLITLPTVLNSTVSVTSNYNGTQISCFGSTDGSANVTAGGGTGSYTYSWSTVPSQTTAAASGLGAGTYSVIVKDVNNCPVTKTVTLVAPTAISATAIATSNYNGLNVSCFGASDGSASVTASGATAPYSYNWSSNPTQTTTIASNLSAGVYSVIVTDINNCAITKTVTLTQPTGGLTGTVAITSNYNGQNISCFGAINGSAAVTASNGTSPYTYTWSTVPAQTTSLAINLSAGNYSVIVKDANGCSITKTVTINQPTQIAATTSITSNYNGQNVSCFGSSNGSASVTATGGTGAYSYTWSTVPAQNTASVNTLSASIYTVTVKDVNNCSTTQTVSLTQPTAVNATVAVTSNYNSAQISCFGSTDGVASTTVNGGTGSYTYSWSTVPSQTTAAASGLGAGTYSVIVKDANNCPVTKTVTLVAPTAISATAVATSNYNGSNISCFGASDGSASVTASGATAPYSYNWSSNPTQTTTIASNLSAGVYSVIVTDINNCAITKTVTLTQPVGGLTGTVAITSNYNGQNISCFGASNGSAAVTASNGTSPYTYTWSTVPAQTTSVVTNLSAGNYSVIITDANGCSITKTLTLNQPSQLVATTSVTSNYNGQNVSCFGSTNGSASVTAIGATSPYTYSWTTVPVQNTASAANLGAGSYSVTVADINGCSVVQTVSLTQPPAVTASLISLSNYNGYNVSCFSYTNGSVDIGVSGGTGTFTYLWSNSASTQDISNVGAGNYSVVATDGNGCQDTLYVNLIQPNPLIITIDSLKNYNGYNISCNGSTNGGLYVSVSGGVTNYSYLWSNGGTTQDLTNIGGGYYNLVVTDLNSCNASIDTTLIQPPLLTHSYTASSPLCNGVSNGSVNLTVSGGVQPMTYNWSNNATTEDINNLGAGTYSVVYTDANGCKDSLSLVLTQPQGFVFIKQVDAIKCYGDSTANIKIYLEGGTLPYSFNWSNGNTAINQTAISSGTYILVLSDANGCTIKDTTTLSQPDPLQISLYSPVYSGGYNVSSYNGNDGSIDLSVSGGTGPYNYIWSNGQTTQDIFNLTAYYPNPFPYSVVVTDSNGCKASGKIDLRQPFLLEMPTAYSPNKDTKNDTFIIHGIEAYPNNTLTIFNRWGNIVYTRSSYNNEWDGQSNNGELLPDATYFAILQINKGEIILKGYVELRR